MNRHQPVLPEDIKNATNKFFELSERCQKMLEDQDISEKAKEFVSTKMQKPWSNLFDCLKKIRKKKDAFSEFNQNAREIVALIHMAESCKRGRHFLIDDDGKVKETKHFCQNDIWENGK